MNQMAVACHSGTNGSFSPSRRSMYCQRMVRMGNTRVATTTLAMNGTSRTARMCSTTSASRTSCSTHHRATTEIRIPAMAVPPSRGDLAGFLEGELDEIENFLEKVLVVFGKAGREFFP